MMDWYQYGPWNLTHRPLLREYRHMTHHTTALLPNSCGLMADGTFGDPIARSYPHPKYWTHWWRIGINIGHGISRTESSSENQDTWYIVRQQYYQLPAAQWRMVHLGTPRVGPINNPNIGPIDEGLISISDMESHHSVQVRESRHMTYHTMALLPNSCGSMADDLFQDPKVDPIHTPYIRAIDEGLLSISAIKSNP